MDFSAIGPGIYDFTYTIPATGGCPADAATVTVTITDQPLAGTDAPIAICTGNGASTDLFAALGGADAGGTWNDDDASGADLSDPTDVDFSAIGPGIYDFTYTIPATGGCPADAATVTVTITDQPLAGTDAPIAICTGNGASTDLFAALGGADAGGTWNDDDASGADLSDPTDVDFSAIGPGIYDFTYTIPATGGCPADAATVTVTITDQPLAGTDAPIAICTGNGASTDLFAALGGADAGGTWNDDDASGADLSDPTDVDFSAIGPGIYDFTYTIPATGGCPADAATVTVTITDQPLAGTDAPIAICTGNGASTDLFAALGGADAGGTWNDDDASGADLSDPTDVDFSAIGPGIYDFTYTIPATGGCPADAATVTVTITDQPLAGTDAPIAICTGNGASTDLFAALGGADAGGTWNDDDASGADLSDPTDVDFSAIGPGIYDFTYTIPATGGCPADAATVTVTITDQPLAGTDAPIAICTGNGASTDLFAALGGADAGGTWNDDDASGADLSDPTDVDFSAIGPGIYDFTYTIPATGGCPADAATVTVTITDQPLAGTDAPIAICTGNGASTDLFAALGGADAGGTWNDDDASGADLSDPTDVDFSAIGPGIYDFTYTIPATGGCPADAATVTVTITDQPLAGTDAPIAICTGNGASTDLFAALGGADAGGTWNDDDASGADLSDPTDVDFSAIGPGIYDFTYTIPATGGCPADAATVTVTITDQPLAGTDAPIAICTGNGASTDLFAALGGADAGGTWNDDDASGADLSDPTDVDFSAIGPGIYDFTYTIPATGGCPADAATVTVTITDQPLAGTDAPIAICTGNGASTDLFAALGGADAGGTWNDDDASGADLSDPTDVDFSAIGPGIYDFTYTIPATGGCPADAATVTVTITDQPLAGTDAPIAICTGNGASTDLFAALGGADAGGTWNDDDASGADLSDPTDVDFSAIGPGIYDFTYTIPATGGCPADAATVTVTITDQPLAGTDAPIAICTGNGASTDLFAALGGADAGGTWNDDDASGADLSDPTDVDFSAIGPGIYDFTYTIPATGGCPADAATVTVTITDQPLAGTDAPIAICTGNGASTDLFAALGGADAGGTWNDDDASGADLSDPTDVDFSAIGPGIYDFTYTIPATGGCPADAATVTVTITDQPLAGTDAPIAICTGNGASTDLFAALGGADAGGTWNDDDASGADLSDPTDVDFSAIGPGIYDFTYTIPATGGCPADAATVTVTITDQPLAGTDAPIAICTGNGASTDLFAALGGADAGGTWNDDDASGADLSDPTDVDFSAIGPGIYDFTYTIPATGGCPADAATVTVTITDQPLAGTDAPIAICTGNGASTDLFAALGGADAGGTWNDDDASGADLSDPTDVDFSAIGPGIYDFTYTIPATGGCPADAATVTVTITDQPLAGTDAPIAICTGNGASTDLFAALGGADAGGTWNDDDASGADLSDPTDVDFSAIGPGIYDFTYTIPATGGCPADAATVTVTITDQPLAGTDAPIAICTGNGASTDLFAALGGADAGGTWNDDDASGADLSDPTDVDFSAIGPGIYDFTYTIPATGGCPADAATVTVTITDQPLAGTDAPIAICTGNGASTDLFAALGGADAGGTWNDDDASGADLSDPTDVDFSAIGPGIYDFTYTIPATGGCPADAATVTVTITDQPLAGTDAPIAICTGNGASTDLFAALGGADAGGTWNDDDASGADLSDPTDVDFSAIGPGIYDFTYTIPATGGCPADAATVTVTITDQPLAGTDAPIAICTGNGASTDLFAALGGADAGGTWNDDDASGADLSDPTDVDFSAIGPGIYDFTYTIPATGGCPADAATVTVTITDQPLAGTDAPIAICTGNGASTDLFAALGGADAGGTWNDDDASGADLSDPTDVDFSAIGPGIYDFTYTIPATGGCPADAATVTVTITDQPLAGTDAPIAICTGNGASTDLFAALGGADAGGTWNDDDASGADLSDPTDVDFSAIGPGIYDFTYTIPATGGCPADAATVTVTITDQPLAGTDAPIAICTGNGASTDLFAALGGADAGGTWNDDDASGADLSDPTDVDFSAIGPGIYDFTYTIPATGGCPADAATVTVTITDQPLAGTDAPIAICTGNGASTDLFAALGGADAGGTWNDDDASGADLSDPTDVDFSAIGPGIYDFTYTIPATGGCPADAATVTVTITDQPLAGTDAPIAICTGNGASTDLFAALGGADAGGTWNDDDASGADLSDPTDVDFSAIGPGIYDFTYTIPATGGCPADAATVTVTITDQPLAGTDAPIAICTGNGASTDLFAALGGADAGGTWNDDDASGADLSDPTDVDFSAIGPGIYDFTYTIPATGGCPADAATVTVTITDQPLAGTDAPIAICTGNGASTDLFAALGGADAGGTWNDDDASGADLSDPTDVDFSAIGPGIYDFTYTIPATGGCPADAATVTVTITDQPLAGTDAPIAICTGNGASTDLFAALGGADAGGTWNDDDASGADLSDPTDVDFSAIGPGIYDFTYTIPATGGCPADAATVTVTITDQPLAGTDAPIAICTGNGASTDLFAALGGADAGGTWNDDDASGADLSDPTDVDFSAIGPGIYDFTYTIPATGGCPADAATVTVTITDQPLAGTDAPIAICTGNGASTDLFAALGGADAGGTWNDDDASGADLSDPTDVDFSAIGPGIYDFTYTIPATGGCPADAATVTVTIQTSPSRGQTRPLPYVPATGHRPTCSQHLGAQMREAHGTMTMPRAQTFPTLRTWTSQQSARGYTISHTPSRQPGDAPRTQRP
ncbi:beta strand repeat-containing protein [Flagellimonas sp. C4]|uniref:beta strand repeat-containing protein n=1 Tax=Flagellimonas alginolytica TaxID=3177515 RepID=UPI0035C888F9